jgi:hypothetical protein
MLVVIPPSPLEGEGEMPRKPTDLAHVNLRIREGLRRRLEREAKRHVVSLNYEICSRLERSLQAEAVFDLRATAHHMNQTWLLYAHRFMRLKLEDDLLRMVFEAEDLATAKALIEDWFKGERATEFARRQAEEAGDQLLESARRNTEES